jgi:uncharacterized membrane protein YgdD (TMEM256/DUF423 family)
MNLTAAARFSLVMAGILGLTGVALGAMGAHQLEPALTQRGMLHAWETASRYHIIHAVALLGLAAWQQANSPENSRAEIWVARCWSAGTILFSGSLYLLAVGGPRWLGPVTPLGGVALLAGWGCLIAAAFLPKK